MTAPATGNDTNELQDPGYIDTAFVPAPRPAPNAIDATMASGVEPDETAASGGIAPVRSETRADDYRELATLDPQRYAVGEEIARGGMGRITAARDRRLGRPVAIKELLIESGDLRARFEREARITATLQHPAIVNLIEAGTWPSGAPFYVMKLVIGESLDKAIAQRPTLEARLGLLANVIAAVDALAYAHSMRVIHRDLKPANVLVGAFGETVVIDWGLAKDLADVSGGPDITVGPYRTASGAPGATLEGSILGTPAYMPAEQALGDAVDERADVYSLGAMLYHVLAGVPPYTGKTADLILDAVVAGPPPPLGTRALGVPPDLVTIVEKAMAHASTDRYPTAKELAEDLKKFQTGQLVGAHDYSAWQLVRRWMRRHRTAIAVATVAIVVLGVVGVVSLRRIVREQARTEEQRQFAERSRGQADDLTSFMVVDLRDKLGPLGKLNLLDDVAKKAVAYYDARGDNLSDDELRKLAVARRNLGDVLSQQGHADAAVREYRAALAISDALAAKDPASIDGQREVFVGHVKVGDVVFAQADAASALVAYRTSLAIAETLAAKNPTSAGAQRDLSIAHRKIGIVVQAQGNVAGGLAEFRAALAIGETLAARDPIDADAQRELASDHDYVGDAMLTQRNMIAALEQYRAGLAIRTQLVANDPANLVWQRNLSSSHYRVGNVLFDQGDTAGALAEFRASAAIRTRLAASDPTNSTLLSELMSARGMAADVLRMQGDATGATIEARASLAIAETLAAIDPTNARAQEDRATGHSSLADALLAEGKAVEAVAEYQTALTIGEQLAATEPKNATWHGNLMLIRAGFGDALLALGDTKGALAKHRAALATGETLIANDPTNLEARRNVAVSHGKVGDVLFAQGNRTAAFAEYRAALAVLAHMHDQDPTNVDFHDLESALDAKLKQR